MNDPHSRRFGVEIECGLDGGCDEAARIFKFGRDDWGDYDYENAEGWTLHDDGSGVELGSPILEGEAGFKIVTKMMTRLKNAGAFVTDYDGLHVHHDAPEFVDSPSLCVKLIESWRNNEQVIRDFVSPRRHGRGACPGWTDYDLDRLRQWAAGEDVPFYFNRNDCNLLALREHGTVEIRLLEGTLDPEVAIAWIKFGQKFLADVLDAEDVLPTANGNSELLRRLNLSPDALNILAEKASGRHDTPASRFDSTWADYDDNDDEY